MLIQRLFRESLLGRPILLKQRRKKWRQLSWIECALPYCRMLGKLKEWL